MKIISIAGLALALAACAYANSSTSINATIKSKSVAQTHISARGLLGNVGNIAGGVVGGLVNTTGTTVGGVVGGLVNTTGTVVGGLVNTTGTVVGGLVNTTTTVTVKVNTILDTAGVPSTKLVESIRLLDFCPSTAATTKTCKSVQNTVAICIDTANNCTVAATRSLLITILDQNPCAVIKDKNSLQNKICLQWRYKAKKCLEKSVRGPCSKYHQNYLLRQFRDLNNLPKTHVPVIAKKNSAALRERARDLSRILERRHARWFGVF